MFVLSSFLLQPFSKHNWFLTFQTSMSTNINYSTKISFCLLFEVCFQQYIARKVFMIQVNLCHELLFLHQLTQNMTTDCSIHDYSKLKPGENMLCTEIVSDIQNNFCTQLVLPMFCKKKSFWQRFTCTEPYSYRHWTESSHIWVSHK